MVKMIHQIQITMLSLICSIVAVLLASFAHKRYRFISVIVAAEFVLHYITYEYLFLDFRATNSAFIYLAYIIIQMTVLALMFSKEVHLIIALLIFINLSYNFLTILQHMHITFIDFHEWYWLPARTIMILELIYLLGITSYVNRITKQSKMLDIDRINRLLFIRRGFVFRNMGRETT